jgi:hypothetical protein
MSDKLSNKLRPWVKKMPVTAEQVEKANARKVDGDDATLALAFIDEMMDLEEADCEECRYCSIDDNGYNDCRMYYACVSVPDWWKAWMAQR